MIIFALSARQTKTNTCANSIDPDETARNESILFTILFFIIIYFRLKPLFASVDKSKFKNGRVQKLRDERIKSKHSEIVGQINESYLDLKMDLYTKGPENEKQDEGRKTILPSASKSYSSSGSNEFSTMSSVDVNEPKPLDCKCP